jgi:hypothetical protein
MKRWRNNGTLTHTLTEHMNKIANLDCKLRKQTLAHDGGDAEVP